MACFFLQLFQVKQIESTSDIRMKVGFKSAKARSFCTVSVASLFAMLLVRDVIIHREGERDAGIAEMFFSKGNRTVITSRKLLQSADDGGLNHIGTVCSKEEIVIYQGEVPPLPTGIPSYTVQIMNMCASDCDIADIRLHCGWFSSARLINPKVFRRVGYDDCLVNDGKPLASGKTVSFQYSNTFRYPLSVSSVVCSS
ncbi:TPD1 protein homolog 1-like isoform X1 [Vigna radiata var. radiata]|uniref:TPD1 protein homolog 1-like isoform X1 n=2 Tax=Vigna radiata var. radiata TaxID=3916 RepID=A0A1S3UHL0_VIGRR|nr:TPD1 protein homolog 1-like isoform X1 [Vigna radiata var. radiata]XP_022639856.1 TPD1 protein homolog 1-like isoform X1 [Vigna radiata var. radiata]